MIIFKNKKIEIPVGLGPNFQEDSGEIFNQNKTVDSSTFYQRVYPDPGYTGLGRVIVNPYALDSKIVDSSTELQIVTSDKDGLYRVVVKPYQLDAVTVDSSTKSQIITGAYGEITVNPYVLDEKTVDSSSNVQIVTSDEDGLRQVTVRPYVLGPLEVDSSTAMQEITGQFGTVTVNPYVLDSSNAVITENGDYAFESSADGLSRVDVSVNIDTQSYYDDGYLNGKTAGIAEQKAKLDSSTFTSNGTYTREDGWNEVTVNTPVINNQDKVADPSTNTQIITFDSGYTGIGQLTLNPYILDEKTVDSSTSPQVITSDKDGLSKVTIKPYVLSPLEVDSSTAMQEISGQYGTVTVNPYVLDSSNATLTKNGDYSFESSADGLSRVDVSVRISGGPLQSKTIDSSTKSQTVTPSSGYYGLSRVIVHPYVLDSKTVKSSTSKQTVTSSKDGLSSVIVEPYVLDSKTVDPSTNNITVTSSKDGLSSVTVTPVTSSIDSNIQAGNIKKDVTILGVTGTYEGGGDPVPVPVEYISNEGSLNLVFNSGYIPNENTRIVARIAWGGKGQPGAGAWGNFFGIQNNFALREWGGYGSATGEITWQTIGGTCAVQNVYTTPGDLSIVRDIEVGNNYVKADSSSGSSGKYSGHISDYPMFIFGAADPGNGQLTELSSRVMRIHSFAIYEGATLIKNLVPYQDANLNGCFYDTVSKTYIYPLQGNPTVGPVAIYQQKTVDASLNAIEVTADAGFKALSKVTVNGVTAAVDPNITPGNIKAGVNILGVGGSFAGAIYHRIGYVANNSTNKKIFRNTGIIPKNNTRIEATVSFDDIATGQSGYGYFWGTTRGATFVVREMGGYGSRNVSYFDGNGIGYYSSDMSSAPRTYTHGQVEGDYSFMSYGGFIDKRSAWSHTWTAGDEIFIWAANKGNDTVDEYSSRVMRLYEFKIYEGDNLVFHGVPAADNDGNAILLDLVSNKLVDGEGTLTGGGVYVEPDEESWIENGQYTGSRATPYINIGACTSYYDLSDTANVKAWIEVVASIPQYDYIEYGGVLLGYFDGANETFVIIVGGSKGSDSSINAYGGSYGGTPAGNRTFTPGMHVYNLMTYKNNNSTYNGGYCCLSVDRVPQLVRTQTLGNSTNSTASIYLFRVNYDTTNTSANYRMPAGTRIYQIRHYDPSDNLVHVLVPAYNNNKYCLYDVVSNTYHYTETGTLTGHITNRYLSNNGAINVFNG